MARALTQRMTTVAGWSTLLVTLIVCGLGLRLTQLQYRSLAVSLLDLEKRSAESARTGLEDALDSKLANVLGSIRAAGDSTAKLRSLAAAEPLIADPFLVFSDGDLLSPDLATQRGSEPGPDEAPPLGYEKAMKSFWSVAQPAEKLSLLEEVAKQEEIPSTWRLKARALHLALLARAGEVDRAAEGYRALFAGAASALLESSAPSYLHLATARLDCLWRSSHPEEVTRWLEEVYQKLDRGDVRASFEGEDFFLRRSRASWVLAGATPPEAARRVEKRHTERGRSLAAIEALRDWILARERLERAQPDGSRPRCFFDERAAAHENGPVVLAWSKFPAGTIPQGLAAAGFRLRLEELERFLDGALASSSPGSRLSVRASPAASDENAIDLTSLRGDRSFVRLVLEKQAWDERVGRARQPFVFAGALIAALMALLFLVLIVFLRGVRREMALSRMKTELVANVSHELKTPLALIRLFGETLLLGRANEESREKYYRIITRESERLTHLISSLLSFASIEAEKKRYELKPCDIAQVVRETFESYRFHLDEKGFTHRFHGEESAVAAKADGDAVAEAVINLIENAVKYSKDRKDITVSVRARNGEIRVAVADRGIGIAPQEQGKVFEDYYRSPAARALGTRGSGLGLSLVRHILEAHGGRVELESRPDDGSIFTLVFPAGTQETP